MRPLTVRSYLVAAAFGGVTSALVCAAALAWVWQINVPATAETLQWLGGGIAAAMALTLVVAIVLARPIVKDIASFGLLARTLARGEQAVGPAKLHIGEIAQASHALVDAINTARNREKSLRNTDRAKDEFVATLGHELRNPLNAMAAAAQVLRMTASKDEAPRQATDTIVRQVELMARLIEDLLDVSRVTRGKLSLNREALDLAAIAHKTVRELRASGRLDQHQLRLELGPAWVRADEARVSQIVANLVVNAVKYTPPGGQVTVSVTREGNAAMLRVRDTGIGMAPDFAARVFDMFVQAEHALQQSAGGLGIGLTLVKHLAELHGGKAFAASNGEGQGSLFAVSLPAIDAQPEAHASSAGQAAERRPHRIVLIEDNDDARRSMVTALTLDGHQVYAAADGRAGIQTVASVNPDVAVIDVGLPGLNGYQVAETLRDTPARGNMVLIALTGHTQPDSLRRAREAGFDDYVTKPISPERLVRLVDVALAAKARRDTRALHH